MTRRRRLPPLAALSLLVLLPARGPTLADDEPDSPGGQPHRVHALVGARVVTRPGELLEVATIVVRDGTIEAAGKDVVAPADARVWDARGLTVYAGLIEPYLRTERPPRRGHDDDDDDDEKEKPAPPPKRGPGAAHRNPAVRPERSAAADLAVDEKTRAALRKAGFTAALLVPGVGVLRGESALVVLRDGSPRDQVLRPRAATHVAFDAGGGGRGAYPGSLQGAVALVRQALLDAQHHLAAARAYAANPVGQRRPEANVSLEALARALAEERPVVVEAEDAQAVLRAVEVLGEHDLVPWVVLGDADPGRWLEDISRSGAPLLLSLNFPPPPAWDDPDEAEQVPLESLRRWWRAPGGAARLEAAGARFTFTTDGLDDRGAWRERVRRAIARGLTPDAALAALTTAPAALLRAPQLGVVQAGCIANLTVCDGDLFAEGTSIVEVWVDGARHDLIDGPPAAGDVAGAWTVELEGAGQCKVELASKRGELQATFPDAPKGDTRAAPRPARLWRDRLELTLPAALAGTAVDAPVVLRLRGGRARGTWSGTAAVGGPAQWGEAAARREPKRRRERRGDGPGGERPEGEGEKGEEKGEADEAPVVPSAPVDAWAAWPPLPEPAPPAVLFRGATVWTLGPGGTRVQDVLVTKGTIAAIGTALEAPSDALVVDGRGKHLAPGIVDCHSHAFIAGAVNEATSSCTAECRIHDVLDAETVDLYRQLAGGVTTSNLLHGSANAIGGQNAVVQLRWGSPPAELRFDGAPAGIKFALGENPRRSNWGGDLPPRYPTSRSGVEELIRERFLAARNYRREVEAWREKKDAGRVPPRLDLQLEALAEVLEGDRLVHCHSYRQDEILAMIRLAEELGFTVGTFQHALEAYKVADEIAAHGAGVSTFSDWWAYKFEVYDAIPWNGALCVDRGVVTSFNSDSAEMARRLNQEAAKAVRYGGLSEVDALGLVTLAPARQLGVTARTGSIEVGKQADLVLWSAPPLSMQARVEETWLGGRRHYEKGRDAAARARVEAERRGLLAAAEAARRQGEGGKPGSWRPTFGAHRASSGAGCCDLDHEGGGR